MVKAVPTAMAARKAGISPITLQRWIAARRVKAPALRIRHGRAVRLWTVQDLERLRQVKQATYCRGRGRKKRKR